jgi:hypothetical protein
MLFFLAYDHVLLEKNDTFVIAKQTRIDKILWTVIQQKGIKNTEKLNNK